MNLAESWPAGLCSPATPFFASNCKVRDAGGVVGRRKPVRVVAPALLRRGLIAPDLAKRPRMSRTAESHVRLASGGKEDLRQLFALSFSEPARDDDDLRHAVLDYVRNAKEE